MFLQELDHASLLTTYEAFEALFLGVDHEGTEVAVSVKRAQSEITNSLLFQVHEVADDLLNLRSVQNPLYDNPVDSWHSFKNIAILRNNNARARLFEPAPEILPEYPVPP